MQALPALGAAILLAGVGLMFSSDTPNGVTPPNPPLPSPAPASGHFVMIVEGDRDQLAVTQARHKPDRWAGNPKGLESEWVLSIRDSDGAELERVLLDMSAFDLRAERKGQPLSVQGCVVRDTRVTMLVNAPCLAGADRYVFLRGPSVVGELDAFGLSQVTEDDR